MNKKFIWDITRKSPDSDAVFVRNKKFNEFCKGT